MPHLDGCQAAEEIRRARSRRVSNPDNCFDGERIAKRSGTVLMRQGVIEVEAEEVWVFADDSGRGDVEDVVVGFLGEAVLVFGEEAPEVAVARVVGHFADEGEDAAFAPVVAGHHEEAGRLGVGIVEVFEIADGGLGGAVGVVAVVAGVGAGQVD